MTLLLHSYFLLLTATLTIIYTEAEKHQIIRSRNQRELRPINNDYGYSYNVDGDGDGDSDLDDDGNDDDIITDIKTYIVNGKDSNPDHFPYQVMLFREAGRFYCGGSLIAPDVVLSAAHCGIPTRVEIGRYSRSDNNEAYDRRDVLYSYRHPRYGKESFAFDMLLLRLREPSNKQPIRLNDNPAIPNVNQLITVTGFGQTKYNGVPSNRLQEVELNAVSNDICSQAKDPQSSRQDFQKGYEGMILDNMLCLSDLSNNGKDACSGDSGGPAILKGNTVEEDIQIGITSWGYECSLPNFPGVYSDINHSIIWIRSSVCTISDQPPNDFNCNSFTGPPTLDNSNGNLLIDITIRIEFALYPERISWAFTDTETMETLIYRSNFDNSMIPSGSYFEEVVPLRTGSSLAYTIWSKGNNGLASFSVGYIDFEDAEIFIMRGRGGGNSDQDSVTNNFVLPSAPATPVPSMKPTTYPSGSPSNTPSVIPTPAPSAYSSNVPSFIPSSIPTLNPTSIPTSIPTSLPTDSPTKSPTDLPTASPTSLPTDSPTNWPTLFPTDSFTSSPTRSPTESPTKKPTREPSQLPTAKPTTSPSTAPTEFPSLKPTKLPSWFPTTYPSRRPTDYPTKRPTNEPSPDIESNHPSNTLPPPTTNPTVARKGKKKKKNEKKNTSSIPVLVDKPTNQPSLVPTLRPLNQSTSVPTAEPTKSLIQNLGPALNQMKNPTTRRERENSKNSLVVSQPPSSTMFPSKKPSTNSSVTSSSPALPSSKVLFEKSSALPTDALSGNVTEIDSNDPSYVLNLIPSVGPSSIPNTDMAFVTTDGRSDLVSNPTRSPSSNTTTGDDLKNISTNSFPISGLSPDTSSVTTQKLLFLITLSWTITMVLGIIL
mmetsp:Transcript_43347/g.49063  ORF Transcript_43347/g.49063 Transcript_43347/m.49063 type:complete len:878 (+) Transcript_43347:85-2718(+)